MIGRTRSWSALFVVLLMGFLGSPEARAQGVEDVIVAVSESGQPMIRVRAAQTEARHFALTGPNRVVLDVDASALSATAPDIPGDLSHLITGVRVARYQTEVVRVVIDLTSAQPYSVDRQGPWWVVTLDRRIASRAPEREGSSVPVEDLTEEAPSTDASNATEPSAARPSSEEPSATGPTPPNARPDGVLEVVVTRVSGSTVYINAGANQGLGKGQNVQAERQVGRGRGSLEVLSTTSTSSVLGFAGRPFSLTRGDALRIRLPQTRGPDRAVAEATTEAETTQPSEPIDADETAERLGGVWALPPNVSGRVSMELDGRASRTDWDPFSPNGTRTFLTPVSRLQFTARDVAGGLSVRGRMRAAYRYGSDGLIEPAASVRVYELDAEKRFDALPLRIQLGRFFSPYEAFSGYWDGLLMRVGNDAFGVGGVVGVEPDRWNQSFSTNRPKATGFVDLRAGGSARGIEADFAVTQVRPEDGRLDQLYVGSSGRLWVGGVGLAHTVQLDRAESGEWIISDMLVQSSIALSRSLEVHGKWSRREPNYFWLDDPFSYRRDDYSAGTTVRWRGGSVLADVGAHQADGDSTWTRSASTALRLNSVSRAQLGMRFALGVWDAPIGRIGTASLAMDRVVGSAWFSGGYRLYRSEGGWQDLTTHQVDATASWTLPDGVRLTGLASTMVGSGVLQQRVQLGVSRSF